MKFVRIALPRALLTSDEQLATSNEEYMFEEFEEITYLISRVSDVLEMHPQTIRHYERIGLIKPKRSRGNVRRYSKEDINKLEHIAAFADMGVNLAGIEIILKLLDQVDNLKKEVEKYRKHFAIQIRKEN